MSDKNIESPYTYPVVAVDRNRWFVVCLVMLLIIVSLFIYIIGQKDNAINKDIVWVRIFPNATWDVTFDDVPNQPEFFESTIESVLGKWVESRYKINPFTITEDYGYAGALMSNSLVQEFVDTAENGGIGALDIISEAVKCANDCLIHNVEIRDIQHYDRISSQVVNAVYRSNVFITESNKESNQPNHKKQDVRNSIVDIEWRFLEKEEIIAKYPSKSANKEMLEYLRLNPVAIEILSYTKYKDTELGE